MYKTDEMVKDYTMDQVFTEIEKVGTFLLGTRDAYYTAGEHRHIAVYACRESMERITGILSALAGLALPIWEREDAVFFTEDDEEE